MGIIRLYLLSVLKDQAMKKEKLKTKSEKLRILIFILGIICIYAFLAVRIFPFMNFVLSEKMDPRTHDFKKYGDLYYYSCINDFKKDLPVSVREYATSERNPSMNNADILTFGDSFFKVSFQKTLPERLSDTLNLKVFSYITEDPTQANPFCELNSDHFVNNGNSKYMVFETVERNIPVKFGEKYDASCTRTEIKKSPGDAVIHFIFKNNSEKLYAVMLKRGYFFNKLYGFFATMRFKLFGYISPLTEKYNMTRDPWVFYYKEYRDGPGCFYYPYSDEEIQTYADNILAMSENLKANYNLELVFMPIPNKYTIYHSMINNDEYNNFLPRLYTELDKRHVRYVNLYDEFNSSKDTLYYGTDTHWNKKGVDKALELTLETMDTKDILDSLANVLNE
jgi:hypothetical protein